MMDQDATAEYLEHADHLLRFASAVANPSAADDIVATVVMRVLVEGDRWRSVRDVRAYLMRSVLNEAIDRERRRRRRRGREQRAASPPTTSAYDGHVRSEVLDAVGRLSARQRAVVYLTYWLDRSASDVAAELDVSVRTVERELTVARRELEVLLR
jgi:RNA polymerase sigma factor (sigma-70 family)